MAGAIRISELDLTPDVTHISTDYQIATDELFANIIIESMDDREHLTDIIFDVKLDPEIKYYARARVRLSTGYTAWGNVDIFTPEDINDIELDLDLPTIVAIPIISLDKPNDNFPLSLFNINVSGFAVNSTAKHISTTYLIETIDGSIVWSSRFNEYNRNSIFVDSIILDKNSVYRIKVMFHSSTGDISQMSTVTVKTMSSDKIFIKENLISIDVNEDLIIHTLPINNMTLSTLSVYVISDTNSFKVFEGTSNSNPGVFTIPAGTLLTNNNYFLTVEVDVTEDIGYKLFTTF